MKARKLRYLLIDDSVYRDGYENGELSRLVATSALEHVRVSTFEDPDTQKEGVVDALAGWRQFMKLSMEESEEMRLPEADLVLIDCNFESDRHYNTPNVGAVDPRGLFFGAVYLAHLFGADKARPVGFSVYSQGAPTDAWAQTAMGLILAMSERGPSARGLLPPGRGDNWARACLSQLENRRGGLSPATWASAVKMYRDRLAWSHDVQEYSIEDSSVRAVMDAADRKEYAWFDKGGALSWWDVRGDRDEVQLRSLFADKLDDGERWGDSANAATDEWLQGIEPCGRWHDVAINWVLVHANVAKGAPPTIPHGSAPFFYALGSLFWWMWYREKHDKASSPKELLELPNTLGFGTGNGKTKFEQIQFHRYFSPRGATLGSVCEQLENNWQRIWPFKAWKPLTDLVVRAWQEAQRLSVEADSKHKPAPFPYSL